MSEYVNEGASQLGSSVVAVARGSAGAVSPGVSEPSHQDRPVLLDEDEQICVNCGKAIKKAALKCRFCEYVHDPVLREEKAREDAEHARMSRMKAYVRQSGFGWLVVAVLQFVFSGFLSAVWGVACVVMGVICLAFPVRPVLAVNGLAMMFIGVGNAAGSLASGSPGFMTYLGVMQVVWGVKELRKFATGEVQNAQN